MRICCGVGLCGTCGRKHYFAHSKVKQDSIMTITSVLVTVSRLMVAKIRIIFKNPPLIEIISDKLRQTIQEAHFNQEAFLKKLEQQSQAQFSKDNKRQQLQLQKDEHRSKRD